MLRKFLPMSPALTLRTPAGLTRVELELNRRLRRALGERSSAEMLNALLMPQNRPQSQGVKGHWFLLGGGHETCPVAATRIARWWPWELSKGWPPTAGLGSAQGVHPLAGEGLGEADAVAAGLTYVGLVQQPVDGRGGQGFGHEFVEPGRVEVAADGDGAFLVGGIHEPIETLGGVSSYR